MISKENTLFDTIVQNIDMSDNFLYINSYTGLGGYASYDQCDVDGYPCSIMDVMSTTSSFFHDTGFYSPTSSMTDNFACNMSYVTKEGTVKKLSGSGENTFSKIRYMTLSSRAHVYRVEIQGQVDIRMVMNGVNFKVLEGGPGMYEINGANVLSYNYEGPFAYEDLDGNVISAICRPIMYYTPENFPHSTSSGYVGVQIVSDYRLVDWYFDDLFSELIYSVLDRHTARAEKGEFIVPHELILKSNQEIRPGMGLYFSGPKMVWIGPHIQRYCSSKVYDTLSVIFSVGFTPPVVSVSRRCALTDIIYLKGDKPLITPYTKTPSSFMAGEAKVFCTSDDLLFFLQSRKRPYTFLSLVNTLVRRNIIVSAPILLYALSLAGIYVNGTFLVVHNSQPRKVVMLDRSLSLADTCDTAYKSHSLSNPWFEHHKGNEIFSKLGKHLSDIKPRLLSSTDSVMWSRYYSRRSILSDYCYEIGCYTFFVGTEHREVKVVSCSSPSGRPPFTIYFEACDISGTFPSVLSVVSFKDKYYVDNISMLMVGQFIRVNNGSEEFIARVEGISIVLPTYLVTGKPKFISRYHPNGYEFMVDLDRIDISSTTFNSTSHNGRNYIGKYVMESLVGNNTLSASPGMSYLVTDIDYE